MQSILYFSRKTVHSSLSEYLMLGILGLSFDFPSSGLLR